VFDSYDYDKANNTIYISEFTGIRGFQKYRSDSSGAEVLHDALTKYFGDGYFARLGKGLVNAYGHGLNDIANANLGMDSVEVRKAMDSARATITLMANNAVAESKNELTWLAATYVGGVVIRTTLELNKARKAVAAIKDFQTKRTKKLHQYFATEGQARQFASSRMGRNMVRVEDNKWRSINGKWQYRAKPGDTSKFHVHLELLNPDTGEVIENYHLWWPEPKGRGK
jgi:hypothetical protein